MVGVSGEFDMEVFYQIEITICLRLCCFYFAGRGDPQPSSSGWGTTCSGNDAVYSALRKPHQGGNQSDFNSNINN
jgi:hypothetical protein